MGKSARLKVSKKATKATAVTKETPQVLSKGQRVRKEKREKQIWKKQILESVVRNKNIDEVGVALGTMEDLAAAIEREEAKVVPNKPKHKGALKQSALFAQRTRDLEAMNKICNYQPFLDDPVGTIQTHLTNLSKLNKA